MQCARSALPGQPLALTHAHASQLLVSCVSAATAETAPATQTVSAGTPVQALLRRGELLLASFEKEDAWVHWDRAKAAHHVPVGILFF